MNENLRASDADRDHVAERLREHYAAGRLTPEELDERLSATVSARTYGDLRAQLTDLPEPELAAGPPMMPQQQPPAPWGGRPVYMYRRGPRLLPLMLLILFAGLLLHGGGFAAAAFVPFMLLPFLVVLTLALTGLRWRHRMRQQWRNGPGSWPGRPGQPPHDWWQR